MGKYPVVDLRHRLPGSPQPTQGTVARKTSVTGHYNGPKVLVDAITKLMSDAKYHIGKNWGTASRPAFTNGIQYEWAIGQDGTRFRLRNPRSILWHCAQQHGNAYSYAFTFCIGEGQRPTREALESAAELVDELRAADNIARSQVFGHLEWSSSACPGFGFTDFVVPYRKGQLITKPPVELAKYNFCAASEADRAIASAAIGELQSAGVKSAKLLTDPKHISYASQRAYYGRLHEVVAALVGGAARQHIYDPAADWLHLPKTESDNWNLSGSTAVATRDLVSGAVDFILDLEGKKRPVTKPPEGDKPKLPIPPVELPDAVVKEPVVYRGRRKLTIIHARTQWSRERAGKIVALAPDDIGMLTDRENAKKYSKRVYDSEPAGVRMFLALGAQAKAMLHPDAQEVLGVYGPSVSDCRGAMTDEDVRDELRAMGDIGRIPKGLDIRYAEMFGIPAEPSGPVTLIELNRIFKTMPQSYYAERIAGLNRAMVEANITTKNRVCHFLGQIGHESGELKHVEELASGAAYEWRRDIGNVYRGDGVRFKGRGYIQLTGRANYTAFSRAMGVDFVSNPELVESPYWAAKSATWFWGSRNLNASADLGDAGFKYISYRVNGRSPSNGESDRWRLYSLAKSVL